MNKIFFDVFVVSQDKKNGPSDLSLPIVFGQPFLSLFEVVFLIVFLIDRKKSRFDIRTSFFDTSFPLFFRIVFFFFSCLFISPNDIITKRREQMRGITKGYSKKKKQRWKDLNLIGFFEKKN